MPNLETASFSAPNIRDARASQTEGRRKLNLLSTLVLGMLAAMLMLSSTQAFAAKIVNHENVPITTDLTAAQVKKGIMKAANARGWQIKEIEPGELMARILVRSHTAVITIKYTNSSFSMYYKDSTNLRYKPGDPGKIHGNYNKWISILKNDIEMELNF